MKFTLVLVACALAVCIQALPNRHASRFTRNDHGFVNFTNHKLVKLYPKDAQQLMLIQALEDEYEVSPQNSNLFTQT